MTEKLQKNSINQDRADSWHVGPKFAYTLCASFFVSLLVL